MSSVSIGELVYSSLNQENAEGQKLEDTNVDEVSDSALTFYVALLCSLIGSESLCVRQEPINAVLFGSKRP